MDTVIGAALWVILIVAVVNVRKARKQRPPSHAAPRPASHPVAGPSRAERDARVVGGWLLGHQIVHGHHGFPGDPLPGGHLGSPADLAFWGSALGSEEDEADDELD